MACPPCRWGHSTAVACYPWFTVETPSNRECYEVALFAIGCGLPVRGSGLNGEIEAKKGRKLLTGLLVCAAKLGGCYYTVHN